LCENTIPQSPASARFAPEAGSPFPLGLEGEGGRGDGDGWGETEPACWHVPLRRADVMALSLTP
jgi:hypothetical protein